MIDLYPSPLFPFFSLLAVIYSTPNLALHCTFIKPVCFSILLYPVSSFTLYPPLPYILLYPVSFFTLYPPLPCILLYPVSYFTLYPPLPCILLYPVFSSTLYHTRKSLYHPLPAVLQFFSVSS